MTYEEAVLYFLASAEQRQLMWDSYLGADPMSVAARYLDSEEFARLSGFYEVAVFLEGTYWMLVRVTEFYLTHWLEPVTKFMRLSRVTVLSPGVLP